MRASWAPVTGPTPSILRSRRSRRHVEALGPSPYTPDCRSRLERLCHDVARPALSSRLDGALTLWLGAIVDANTGALYELDPAHVYVVLEPAESGGEEPR